MGLGNGNPKSADLGSNFNYEVKMLQGLEAIASRLEGMPINTGLWTQIEDSAEVKGITEASLISSSGVGTLTVPANSFKVGDSFHAKFLGHITSANGEKLHIIVKSDGVLLADTGSITLPATTNKHWELNVYFTIRAIGAATKAEIVSGGIFTYSRNASNNFEGTNFIAVNNTTFDTTINNTLEVTAQWGSANPTNAIYSQIFILNKMY